MLNKHRLAALVAVCAVLAAASAPAQDATTAGRDILEKNKESVVIVRLVIRQQFSRPGMGSQQQEGRAEVTGTVVDPSGLTVLSLSETDPASTVRRMLGARARDMQYETEVTDCRILRADGSEVPARIVLRDRDQDLAFIRPTEPPATPFVAANLADAAQPQVLDEIVILSRMGKVANRAYGAAIDRIQAVVERPRTFYIPVGADPSGGLGCPVYSLNGQLVGVTLLRTIQLDSGGLMGGQGDNSLVIVLPASDIQEAAAQAPSVEEAAKQEAEEKAAEEAEAQPQEPAESEPAPEGAEPAPEGAEPAPEPGAPAPVPEQGAPAPEPGAPSPSPAPGNVTGTV